MNCGPMASPSAVTLVNDDGLSRTSSVVISSVNGTAKDASRKAIARSNSASSRVYRLRFGVTGAGPISLGVDLFSAVTERRTSVVGLVLPGQRPTPCR